MHIEPTTVLIASSRHMAAALGDERVLLALDTELYHGLNPAGSFVWDLLQQPISPAEISRRVQARFDVDLATAESDVLSFLQALAAQDLLRPAPHA